jgi:steroid 5-alpha reductase family enzyme
VSLWWAFYLFSVAATGAWVNWTLAGCVFLALLFVPPGASLDVTETLSSRKYAKFPEYQARVAICYNISAVLISRVCLFLMVVPAVNCF